MMVDLAKIREELKAAPLHSPIPSKLARAIVNDVMRAVHADPIPGRHWKRWEKRTGTHWSDQLQMLAWMLRGSSLGESALQALRVYSIDRAPREALDAFFEAIQPLTGEMIRSNDYRQEEFIRRFMSVIGGSIAGETNEESAERLAKLDYRKTVNEYERARTARKAEDARRREEAALAARRAADARGWRE